MVQPQLTTDTPIVGRVRGRGWSDRASWSLRMQDGTAVFRADDPDNPELWCEFEILPSNVPDVAMLLLISVVCGPTPRELRYQFLNLARHFSTCHCATCGTELPNDKPYLWCSSGCFEPFFVSASLHTVPPQRVDLRALKEYVYNG